MVDLSFHICMEEKDLDNCIVNLPILTNAKLAKPLCNWSMGFLQSGKLYTAVQSIIIDKDFKSQ